jgi:hypothetical protein
MDSGENEEDTSGGSILGVDDRTKDLDADQPEHHCIGELLVSLILLRGAQLCSLQSRFIVQKLQDCMRKTSFQKLKCTHYFLRHHPLLDKVIMTAVMVGMTCEIYERWC